MPDDRKFRVVLLVSAKSLGAVIGALEGSDVEVNSAEVVQDDPPAAAPKASSRSPRRRRLVPGTWEVIINALKMRGGRATRDCLTDVMKANGFAEGSVAPCLSKLSSEGTIKTLDNGETWYLPD